MNIVILICYAAVALASGYVISTEFPHTGILPAFLTGGILFLLCALIHENISRRATQTKLTRHLLALKKAYDHTRLELDKARIDNQRLAQSTPSPFTSGHPAQQAPGPEFSRPSFLDPVPELTRESNLFDADRYKKSDDDDFRNLFTKSPIPPENSSPEEPRLERAPPRRTPAPAPSIKPVLTEKEISQVSSEVQILHALVEQLYSDIETPGSRTFESTPPQKNDVKPKPTLKGANIAPPGKLRVVNNVDEKLILDFVREGLRKDQVDLYLQPIVSLPQRKRRFFECFNHIRTDDGTVITQEQYRQVAVDAGILSAIDNMLLFRCIQLLRKVQGQDYSMAFFCNIVRHSLLDKEFFLKFAQYLKTHELLAPSIVLELTQKDYMASRTALTTPMKILGKMGYRFSMDGVSDFNLNIAELMERNFGYLKVDANLIIQQMNQGEGHVFRAFKQRMDEIGIDVIIEQIESEQMLLELLDFSIDYGQGFLFGEPRTGQDAISSLKVS